MPHFVFCVKVVVLFVALYYYTLSLNNTVPSVRQFVLDEEEMCVSKINCLKLQNLHIFIWLVLWLKAICQEVKCPLFQCHIISTVISGLLWNQKCLEIALILYTKCIGTTVSLLYLTLADLRDIFFIPGTARGLPLDHTTILSILQGSMAKFIFSYGVGCKKKVAS